MIWPQAAQLIINSKQIDIPRYVIIHIPTLSEALLRNWQTKLEENKLFSTKCLMFALRQISLGSD